jgi:hypothetical protein
LNANSLQRRPLKEEELAVKLEMALLGRGRAKRGTTPSRK